MYYCKELLSKSVLSLYEGELIGSVDKLYFDKKMKKLIELEIIDNEGVKLILPAKNIYHIGKNAITIKNNQAVTLKVEESGLLPLTFGNKAYSIKGEYLGLISEVSVNEKFLTEKISLDSELTFEVTSIATSGKNTIIFYDKEKINLEKFVPIKSPKFFKKRETVTAEILPLEPKDEAVPVNAVPVDKPANEQNPDFLLGRICVKDIYNFNNELIIKSNSLITKKNLKEIKRYGKLRELMIYTR